MNAYQFIVKMKDYATSELKNIARMAGAADRQGDELNRSSKSLGNTFRNLKRFAAGAFTIVALTTFGNKVIEARAEYERFQAVLTNTSGSEIVAASQLQMLTDFAAKTPFQLNELTGSFVKLVNRGFIPTKNQLGNLGDLAASQGKGFDQLAEAILDAETAEFERLKEFGIRASKAGDQITFSFKGVTKTVNNNSDAIRAALIEYGKMDGVAGSMDAISKTWGGRISNMKDEWNMFLVAVGGESQGIFNSTIDLLTAGLSVMTGILPVVAEWFRILWTYLEPAGIALWSFLQAAFGFEGAGNIMSGFGQVMSGVLLVVNYLSTGLTWLLETLQPVAPAILIVTAAWLAWSNAVAIFNAIAAVNPITWIILGVTVLIGLIGEIISHTDGWGESWKATIKGAKYLWEGFTSGAKAHFVTFLNAIMIGINKIKTGWFEFKELLGIGDSQKNKEILAQINADTEARKKQIIDANKEALNNFSKAGEEFSKINITFDGDGIKKDWQSLKDKFSNLGAPTKNPTSIYGDDKEGGETETGTGTGGTDKNAGAETIVSGGTRKTNINITIQKLQDDTKIFVSSKEEGLSSLGEKTQEILLRAINSINQMQTS